MLFRNFLLCSPKVRGWCFFNSVFKDTPKEKSNNPPLSPGETILSFPGAILLSSPGDIL